MADVKSTGTRTPMLDPIEYRNDNSQNEMVNGKPIGDEVGQKYSGEGTNNMYVPYNQDLRIGDLDPDYQYGQSAKERNKQDNTYIATRNDNIASALYNEGKTSKEDVTNFLQGQQNWYNSTEWDRANTIDNVFNRIGEFQKQNEQTNQNDQRQEGEQPQFGDKLDEENGGTIYGRASGDKKTEIKTSADPYSLEEVELRQRENRFNSLRSMDSYDIALALSSGYSLYGETAMRDLMSYDPAKYQEVQQWVKWIQTGDTVNAIAQGEHGSATEQLDKSTNTVNDSIDVWVNSNSTGRTHDQILELLTGKLANSQTATSATEEMLNLKSQIAELEEKMANLPKEAQKSFKGDVPQYIVDAFVSNNAQRYQAEINKLQSRYNSALDLYKTELSYAQWQAEMELKTKEYNFKVGQQQWENAYKVSQQQWENDFKTRQQSWTETYQAQSLLLNNIKTDKNGMPYIINPDGTYQYLTDATYEIAKRQQIQNGIDTLNAVYQDGMDGGQCEEFTDNFNNTVYGQTMLPVDENGNIIQGRNWTYGTEKVQYVNSAVPEVGMTAIFKYPYTANVSNDAKMYGHTMMVVGYDPTTKMITLKGSNKTGDKKVYTTTMSLEDFYSKKYGAGFWDPTQPTWFQKEQDQVVDTTTSLNAMNDLYGELITNATTEGARTTLATAQVMYNTLADLRDTGALEELIQLDDFQLWLKEIQTKTFSSDDGGNEFSKALGKFMQKKNIPVNAQIALNKLQRLVELKLRKESGAAISSSEWSSNFAMMVPDTFDDPDLRRAKLSNWDDVIKLYSMPGGMGWDEYQPLFDKTWQEKKKRETFPG